jgi:hypothetical protein
VREGEGQRTGLEIAKIGRGPISELGWFGPPGLFPISLFLFPFSFSYFLFLFSIFCKSIQIRSKQFLKSAKINTRFQTSNQTSFQNKT